MEVKRATVSVNKVKCVVSVLVPKVLKVDNIDTHSKNIASGGSTLSSNATDSFLTKLKDDDKVLSEKEQRTLSSPPRFHPHEVVVCITEAPSSRESTNILQMLRLITRPNQEIVYTIEDDRNGEISELRMQSTYLALAHQVLDVIRDFISEDVEIVRNETDIVSQNGTIASENSTAGTVVGNSLNDSQFSLDSVENNNGASSSIIHCLSLLSALIAHFMMLTLPADSTATGQRTRTVRKYDRIRVIGHSAGGAVAALTALMLDGGVFSIDSTVNTIIGGGGSNSHTHDATESGNSANAVSQGIDDDHNDHTSFTADDPDNSNTNNSSKDDGSSLSTPIPSPLPGLHPLTSLYTQRVQCMALGPPPCMSRAIVPKYITSIVCGDDLVPRAQAGALQGLTKRYEECVYF